MNYNGVKCLICDEYLKDGEDIVVCPKCGAPYHKECYKSKNSCIFEDINGEGSEFKLPESVKAETEEIVCPVCNESNDRNSKFCRKCGLIFKNNMQGELPFSGNDVFANSFSILFDPLGGFKKDEYVEDDVKASDVARFVKVNPRYYMSSFKRIKDIGSGRFNFCAFLFTGGWFLYRKQYKLGSIITGISVLLSFLSSYIMYFFSYDVLKSFALSIGGDQAISGLSDILRVITEDSLKTTQVFATLPFLSKVMVFLPSIFTVLTIVLMFICGFKANKIYMRFCCNKIKKITDERNVGTALDEKGGVNIPLGICLALCCIIINEFPGFL